MSLGAKGGLSKGRGNNLARKMEGVLWLLPVMLLLMVVVMADNDLLVPRKWEGWWTRCKGDLDAVHEDGAMPLEYEEEAKDEVKMLS